MEAQDAHTGEVLIATLGENPAVVTEMVDKLLYDGCVITEVIIIHTDHDGVKRAARALRNNWSRKDKKTYCCLLRPDLEREISLTVSYTHLTLPTILRV